MNLDQQNTEIIQRLIGKSISSVYVDSSSVEVITEDGNRLRCEFAVGGPPEVEVATIDGRVVRGGTAVILDPASGIYSAAAQRDTLPPREPDRVVRLGDVWAHPQGSRITVSGISAWAENEDGERHFEIGPDGCPAHSAWTLQRRGAEVRKHPRHL